ncbi:hypothetical protein WDW86_16635 [Bdellovibrionota bacterium FG-2]
MYLLKLALRPWKVSLSNQIFSSGAMGLLLVLLSFLLWLGQGLKPVVDRLDREQVITAYIHPSIEVQDEAPVIDSIKVAVGASASRNSESQVQAQVQVRRVQTEEFFSLIRNAYPDLAREVEDLGAEAKKLVPRYVSITGMLDTKAIDRVRAIPGVESAETSRERFKHIAGAFSTLRWVSLFLSLGIAVALLSGLIHLARTNSMLHRDSLALLRLWGASNFTLRTPSLISGAMVGLLGGALAAGVWLGGSLLALSRIRLLSPLFEALPNPPTYFALLILGCGILLGLFSGLAERKS